MNTYLESFNYFVDDLLELDDNLLKHELDLLLMQHLFNSIHLEAFGDFDIKGDIIIAS